MRLYFLVFIVAGYQKFTSQTILKEVISTTNSAECIVSIAMILGKLKLSIWYSKNQSDIVTEILRKIKTPVTINAIEHPIPRGLEKRIKNDVAIIMIDVTVEIILKTILWDKDTRFLILNDRDATEVFQNFWKYKVINVYKIEEVKKEVLVYTFFPYEKGFCEIARPFIADKYLPKIGAFINNGEVFKNSIRIQNMNGCPINITIVDVKPNVIFEDECGCNGTTHIEGIEGKLMNEVAKNFNFNATFLIALDGIGWGWIHPSPHGAVGEVYTGRSDFAMGLLFPTLERYESLDVSLPYNGEECITFGVPTGAGASTPNWITILVFEFSPITWVLIFFSFVFTFNTFQIMNRLSTEKWFPSRMDIIIYIFSSCFGLPVKVPSYTALRISMTCWIIFTFIITVAYKSSMGSKLTVPTRDPDINTFEELLQSKLELTGYNNYLRLLQYNESEWYIQKMVDRFKVTNFDIEHAVDRISAERKIAHIRHTTTFLYYALINPKAKGHIHVIKDCVNLYHPMVVTKKHSPFSYRLNLIISRLMESGITKRWRSQYIYKVPPPAKPFLKLSKDHMYGVFCILCLGYIIGFLALIKEILEFHLYKKIKNNKFKSILYKKN